MKGRHRNAAKPLQAIAMRRGEVLWVAFDPSLGSEIRMTRPAVIVSKDAANEALTRVVVVPMTSNTTRVYPGEALVMVGSHQSESRFHGFSSKAFTL